MSGELHEYLNKDTSQLDKFFSQFSWAFLNFAAKHHLQVDNYWHDFPSWRFSFKHPKEGAACIEVFREGEAQVSVYAYWWMDDYEKGTRNGRTHQSEILSVDAIEMSDLLEETLTRTVSWPLNSWTDVTTGLGDVWKRTFTKEQFEDQVDNYPNLKP
jgi:predicted MPP superfamily phosphohydrolase